MECVGSRESHGFPGNIWEAQHLQEENVQVDRVNAAHGIQTRLGFQVKVANWGGSEEVLG